eukprot:scaffold8059_cov315-Pinguiococcus_pyrenoidosus.AAC.5
MLTRPSFFLSGSDAPSASAAPRASGRTRESLAGSSPWCDTGGSADGRSTRCPGTDSSRAGAGDSRPSRPQRRSCEADTEE